MSKLWGGRFKNNMSDAVERFTASIPYDHRLYRYDIEGSLAHVSMLQKTGIIKQDEADLIVKGLGEIYRDMKNDTFEFSIKDEDIHLCIEKALIERIGPVGGKMHTARSRNDQVALDLILYLRAETTELMRLLLKLCQTVLELAIENKDLIVPGYTHLQKAQSIPLSHHLLAYYEMFKRDQRRLSQFLTTLDESPLGAGALAGTSFPIDRDLVAKKLGFKRATANSIDTVANRDHVLEIHSCLSIMYIHFSRLAEELIIWASEEFAYLELDDAHTSGSSIMPQKKNPDVAELIRGKTGRIIGNLTQSFIMLKGLPLSYNRDMQEDKEAVFQSIDTVKDTLSVLDEMLGGAKFNGEKMFEAVNKGFLQATELADYLAKKGLPFREAHEITGRIVADLIDQKRDLSDLALADLKPYSSLFEDDMLDLIDPRTSVANRVSAGGASFDSVEEQIANATVWLISEDKKITVLQSELDLASPLKE